MFHKDRFVEACAAAVGEGQKAIREVVLEAVADPAGVIAALGAPDTAGVYPLHQSDDLTVINFVWAPYMTIMPHNHEMWAVISMYTGREDNVFWRRVDDGEGGRIEAAGAKALSVRYVSPLGKDIIHSVTNPIPRLSGAIHVYGGDFFSIARSEWDAETLVESPYDVAKNMKLFEDFGRMTGGEH